MRASARPRHAAIIASARCCCCADAAGPHDHNSVTIGPPRRPGDGEVHGLGARHPMLVRELDLVARRTSRSSRLHIVPGHDDLSVSPFTRLVHVWSAPIWYLGSARLPGGALERPACRVGSPRAATSSRRSDPMSCSVKSVLTQNLRKVVSVNGVVMRHDEISREAQNHPAPTPIAAWTAAARALAVRELLLQEARRIVIDAQPLTDGEGRTETAEEASIRALVEREVSTPSPDEAACRRYYQHNLKRFRSADLYEAAHILIAARPGDRAAYAAARTEAEAVTAAFARRPRTVRRIGPRAFRLPLEGRRRQSGPALPGRYSSGVRRGAPRDGARRDHQRSPWLLALAITSSDSIAGSRGASCPSSGSRNESPTTWSTGLGIWRSLSSWRVSPRVRRSPESISLRTADLRVS